MQRSSIVEMVQRKQEEVISSTGTTYDDVRRHLFGGAAVKREPVQELQQGLVEGAGLLEETLQKVSHHGEMAAIDRLAFLSTIRQEMSFLVRDHSLQAAH